MKRAKGERECVCVCVYVSEGHSCPVHTKEKGETMGHSCLAFARAGLGYLYVESELLGDNVHYMEKRVKWEGEMEKVEVKSYLRQTAWHHM